MEKYLVNVEFRYNDKKPDRDEDNYESKTITIGVFDTLEEANTEGNKLLEILESNYPLHEFPDGRKAAKERFSKHGGAFGSRKDLITNMAYLKTPFSFFARVKKLQYLDVQDTIDEALASCKRYRAYKLAEQD